MLVLKFSDSTNPEGIQTLPVLYLPEIHCKVRYPEELSVLLYKEKLFPMAYSFLF